MKEMLVHVARQLEKLDEKLDTVDRTLVKQEENLREHMRRTEILEKQHIGLQVEMQNELKPIRKHVTQVKSVIKFVLAIIPILLTIGGVVYKYLL